MNPADLIPRSAVSVKKLVSARDVPGLIRLLGHRDPEVRQEACQALSAMGTDAIPLLENALQAPSAHARLGAICALGAIRDKNTVRSLSDLVIREKLIELRFAAVLALGETGSVDAVPSLIPLLNDMDKYIRLGAAISLVNLGWDPPDEPARVACRIALQDWDAVRASGVIAIGPLRAVMCDTDPSTRSRIATLLGEIGAGEGGTACEYGLKDRDPRVRWAAVLAAMGCGIRTVYMPPFVAARERTGPNPYAAALLNFLFLGIGYNYIGKWWGFPVFMAYMSVLVLAQLAIGPFLPYLIAYPVTAVLGAHTYYLARRMSDL